MKKGSNRPFFSLNLTFSGLAKRGREREAERGWKGKRPKGGREREAKKRQEGKRQKEAEKVGAERGRERERERDQKRQEGEAL